MSTIILFIPKLIVYICSSRPFQDEHIHNQSPFLVRDDTYQVLTVSFCHIVAPKWKQSVRSIFVTLFFAIYSIAMRRCSQRLVLIRQNLVREWLNFIVTTGTGPYIVSRGLYTVFRGAWRQILIDFGHIQDKETRNTVNYTNASFPSAQLMTSHTLS